MIPKYVYCVNCGASVREEEKEDKAFTLCQEEEPHYFCEKCWRSVSMLYGQPPEKAETLYQTERNNSNSKLTKSGCEYIEKYIKKITEDPALLPFARDEQTESDYPITITSGFNFEGYAIKQYLGFVSTEAAVGLGFLKGVVANAADLAGVKSETLNKKLSTTKDYAISKLKKRVFRMGGNAIIGMALNYVMFGGSLLGVVASGTAVLIEKHGE